MNKNQLVYIIGGGLIGIVGLATTWYAGRKSYKQGVQDGWDNCMYVQEFTDKLQKMIDEKKTES